MSWSVILIDSFFKEDKNYYPQAFLKFSSIDTVESDEE